MLESVARAIIALLQLILGLFSLLHAADKKLSENSRIGKSPMQEEHHRNMDSFLDTAWFQLVFGGLFLGGLGYAFWREFSR